MKVDPVRAVGWLRSATGVALVAAPGRTTRTWTHEAAGSAGGRLAARSLAFTLQLREAAR